MTIAGRSVTTFRHEPTKTNAWYTYLEYTPLRHLALFIDWSYMVIDTTFDPESNPIFGHSHSTDYHGPADLLVGGRYQLLDEADRSPISLSPFLMFRSPTHAYGSEGHSRPGISDPQMEAGLTAGRFFTLPWIGDWVPGTYAYVSTSLLHAFPTGTADVPDRGLVIAEVGGSPIKCLDKLSLRGSITWLHAFGGFRAGSTQDFIDLHGGATPGNLSHQDTEFRVENTMFSVGLDYQLTPKTGMFASYTHEVSDRYLRMVNEVQGFQVGVTRRF